MPLGKLDNQLLVSVVDFVQDYDVGEQPDYGLEYLEHFDRLDALLAPHEMYPKLREVSKNRIREWERCGRVPYSVQAIETLEAIFRKEPSDDGLSFPIRFASPKLDELNIIAAYVFFSGYVDQHGIKISVPNSVLNCVGKEDICISSLDQSLSRLPSKYASEENHLLLTEGGCAIGRVLKLLDLPQEDKNQNQVEFPLYIQVASKEAAEDSLREYKAWRLADDWVRVMILSKGFRKGNSLRMFLFLQPDKQSANYLCKDAKAAIACIFPDLKDNIYYRIDPKISKAKKTFGETFYEPRVGITGGVPAIREHYTGDPLIEYMLC